MHRRRPRGLAERRGGLGNRRSRALRAKVVAVHASAPVSGMAVRPDLTGEMLQEDCGLKSATASSARSAMPPSSAPIQPTTS